MPPKTAGKGKQGAVQKGEKKKMKRRGATKNVFTACPAVGCVWKTASGDPKRAMLR